MPECATILIPAHNRRALTLACLAALRANGDLAHYRVVVIDDGSSDGTCDAVRAAFSDTIVLHGDGNLYWTGAIQLAMRADSLAGAERPLFWLNDDTRPQPGALAALSAWLEENPTGLAGPRCLDTTTGKPVPTGFIGRRVFSASPGETRVVQGLSGFCIGIGATARARLGPPDARRFPHYAGDTAYTLRASRSGHRVVILGDATIDLLHYDGGPRLTRRVRAAESLAASGRRLFTATNSPYRLKTLLALQQLKYGRWAGTALAVARGAIWMAQLAFAKCRAK